VETFVKKCDAFVKSKRLLKYIFREVEAFFNLYEDFTNITRLFEDIYRERGTYFRIMGLF
jgi:hypothetical protein